MNLIKRNGGLSPLPSLLSDWYDTDSFFSSMLPELKAANLPSINIKEDEGKFALEVAAPGMSKNDFKININNNILEISADKKEEKKDEGKNYVRREFNYTSFVRSFSLPETANMDAIRAEYKDGILLLEIPKKEEAKKTTKKQITIS